MGARGSFGKAFGLGRLETGRDLGKVFAVDEAEKEALVFEAAVGIVFVMLLNPNLGPVFRCSVEAEGRSRVGFAAAGAPASTSRSFLGGNGRGAVNRGAGKRDIGRGRPLDFPAVAVFSSMVADHHSERGNLAA